MNFNFPFQTKMINFLFYVKFTSGRAFAKFCTFVFWINLCLEYFERIYVVHLQLKKNMWSQTSNSCIFLFIILWLIHLILIGSYRLLILFNYSFFDIDEAFAFNFPNICLSKLHIKLHGIAAFLFISSSCDSNHIILMG